MLVSLVVAMAENRVIGRAGGLPWHISADLKKFKALTLGKPVIMGRKTFQSIGRPLPGRTNIVITRDASFGEDGIAVADALDAALKIAEGEGAREAMVIGGGEIYRMALPLARRLYLTEVHIEVSGDTLFPALDAGVWKEAGREDHDGEGADVPAYSFVILDRI
jgi:dihydrofolate reductase